MSSNMGRVRGSCWVSSSVGRVRGSCWVTRMMFRIAARDVVPTLHVGSCTFNKQQCYLIKPPRYVVTHHQTHLCAGRPENTVSACWRRLGTAGGVGLPHRQRHHQRSGSALQNIANTEHLASPPPLLLPPLIRDPTYTLSSYAFFEPSSAS